MSRHISLYIHFVVLILVCAPATSMRRGSRMNPYVWLPRDPTRCVVVRLLFIKFKSRCHDPDCELVPCPKWPPWDPRTGKRMKPWPIRKGLNSVIRVYSDLSKLSQLMATKKPSTWETPAKLKPEILYFTIFAVIFVSTLCLCAVVVKEIQLCC